MLYVFFMRSYKISTALCALLLYQFICKCFGIVTSK